MNKNSIILLSIAAVLLIVISWGVSTYNGLVNKDEAVKAEWSNVENQYQRRADLIPNLVATVKGYAAHESKTLEGVVAARAKATQMTLNADNLTPEKLQKYQQVQGEVGSALGRLMMITENYPDLKANQNFKDLQYEISGTANRITSARKTFIDMSKEFNTAIRQFPISIIASFGGFEKKVYFESEEEANTNPTIDFSK